MPRMFGALAKYVGGKVLTGALVVTSVLIVIWYYRMPVDQRGAIWAAVRGAMIWMAFVAVLPWATFFVTVRAARADSNLVSALMLVGYLLADIAFALYLTGGGLGSTWQAAILILGFLCAALYNFVACDFVADRAQEAT